MTVAVIVLAASTAAPLDAAPPPSTAGFTVVVTPSGGINASTWNGGSFQVTNTSTSGETITRLRVDLRSAALPDLVFDPIGAGGDLVAKCFTADAGAALTGLVPPADPCVTPFGGPHDGGYDLMQIDFTGFGPNETFSFSVDIDPTTIKGVAAPGPGESGSVSGLELTGAGVEATFAGGGVLAAQLLRSPASLSGAQVTASPLVGFPAPVVLAVGVPSVPATLASAAQTIRVSGPAGAAVRLVRIEAALQTAGLPGGGFDVDPFEGNSALLVAESAATLGLSGTADIPIMLTRAGTDAGLNYILAAFVDGFGRTGPVSAPIVLVPEDCSAPPPRTVTLTMTDATVAWTLLPGAMAYDLVRGDLTALRASGGDFTLATEACLADARPDTAWDEPASPPPGAAWFYLARGLSCGGDGTYDTGGVGQAAPRDAGINQAPGSCP
jgi:hypothetical protein